MKIHPIRTGTVRLKRRYVAARWRRRSLRYLDILADRRWTAPLPVHAWVVEHPDGLVVVDAGATVACYDRKRREFRSRLLATRAEWFDVAPEEEIGPQFRRMGLDPDDVRWVVETHLGPDHADGVAYFRNAEVVVARREWEASSVIGVDPDWPTWVRLHTVDYDCSLGPFPESHVFAEGVVLVATSGHTPGHQSVICHDDECAVFLAGDATFSQAQLLSGGVGGIVHDYDDAEATIERIRGFAQETPTVYLPAHDPEAPRRLRRRETVPLARAPSAETESTTTV
ncbi:N-acyl homoserine lactonase family protein [Salinigranum salinum]|uniref:N-acyl homoserine lactonase family protein n=1 Tax=Salinigranum salinum TaxID=1364937 RepID=UPI001864BE85|nr:N-acyl homoserine lactonase family protein [Salinigranum salinum]